MGKKVTLAFLCKAETRFGQSIRVVGDCDELGNWDPERAPALTTDASEYPIWFGNIQCRAVPTEYKFVKFDEFQGVVWEEGNNRYFEITDEGVVTRSRESGEPATPIFGVKDPLYVPRLASGRSGKTSFEEVKDAMPIPATPKNKVASGTAGFQDELHFKVVCPWTGMGDYVSVVGSCEELGNWNVKKGIKLCTSPDLFPLWTGVVQLQSCSLRDVEFKAVIVRPSSEDWESNHNRRLSLPADDEEGPWEAFLNFNSNGVKVANLRSSPVQKAHDSKEDAAVVGAAFQESMPLATLLGEQRRSPSLSLLGEKVPCEKSPLVAESLWRCQDLAGPSPKELLEDGQMVEKTRSEQIGDMVFDSVVGDDSSADATGLKGGGQIVCQYSVREHLAFGDSDGENDKENAEMSQENPAAEALETPAAPSEAAETPQVIPAEAKAETAAEAAICRLPWLRLDTAEILVPVNGEFHGPNGLRLYCFTDDESGNSCWILERGGEMLNGVLGHPGFKVPMAEWVEVVNESLTPLTTRGRQLQRELAWHPRAFEFPE